MSLNIITFDALKCLLECFIKDLTNIYYLENEMTRLSIKFFMMQLSYKCVKFIM